MLRRLLSAVALSAVLAAPAQAQYVFGVMSSSPPLVQLVLNGTTTITANDQGWWQKDGLNYSHNAANDNYIVGLCCGTGSYRNFFLFSVPADLTITSAALRLNSFEVTTTATYQLFDYLGSTTALSASTSTLSGAIYNDLGAGVQYGSRFYSSADNNLTRDIALNAGAISALTGARGGLFAMGGRIDADIIDVIDVIDVPSSSVPEPSTYALMGAGLAALFVARRKRSA